jgi:[protein-PII] uridylyltransferase
MLRPAILAAKERLAQGRETLRQRHESGSAGVQVCQAATELLDGLILDLFQSAVADLDQSGLLSQIALVPLGGFGRRELAPFSDIDLMILYEPTAEPRVRPLVERMVRDVSDIGVSLGHSARTISAACQLARGDASIFTALTEARFLAGSTELFAAFQQQLQQMARRRRKALIRLVADARDQERAQYGETVYLLEPNLKRSRGGLRDIQLLRWLGFAAHETSDLLGLHRSGALSEEDFTTLRDAGEYLLQLRNEMHFHAGKAHDVLDRSEQVRLAKAAGYQMRDGLLPVEQFMQEYFERTKAVSNVATRFTAACRPASGMASLLEPLIAHQVEGDFRVGSHISATRRGRAKLRDLCEILRLADLANRYDKPIALDTVEALREAARHLPDELSPAAAQRFLALLEHPARLGDVLRVLHEARILERIIPGFARARSLLQFNEYHKYTVDEHCIHSVERVTKFLHDPGPVGEAYRGIKNKSLLHLALLLHDLGKGHVEDHSEVGARLAEETAVRLRLPAHDAETLRFLVHKHLLMSHLSFRRDTSDERLLLDFVGQVGSPEVLQMLFVLTCADLAAVGPDVFNDWKRDVLAGVYRRAMGRLDASHRAMTSAERLRQLHDAVWQKLGQVHDTAWFADQIAALPASYFDTRSPEEIARELAALHDLPAREVVVRGRYETKHGTVEFTIMTNEEVTPGVFYKLTGALTSHGLEILAAEINTLAHGLIVDRFVVHDNDFDGQPPAGRIESVCEALRNALFCPTDKPPAFRRLWRSRQGRRPAEIAPPPTRVVIDNSTSERYTIVDVFTLDRMGLLYTIARALFDLGLSVSLAKIGTYLDQVVDVFYVIDLQGHKVHDDHRVAEVRDTLLARIAALEQQQPL